MHKKTLFLNFLAFAFIIVTTGCQKDDLDGKLQLSFEKMNNTSKVAIDGTVSHWVDGDEIRINNSTKSVSVAGSTATIPDEGLSAPYYAVYPASLAATADLTLGTVTVDIPDEYNYIETGDGNQKLDIPMAACAASGNSLKFKHLTAALMVRVTNSFGGSMQVHSIVLESDLSQISGRRTIDLTSNENIQNQPANDVNVSLKQKQVRMKFPSPLEIASGYKDILIPVCPVSNSNKFTVTVVATYNGSCHTFSFTQQGGGENTDRSLARNEMGYVPIEMSAGGSHITSSSMVTDLSSYKSMVAAINAASSGTLNYTISGTIDFSGAYADSIVVQNGVTLNISGVNNATLQNLKFRTHTINSINYCGWVTGSSTSNINLSDITLENVDLSEASDTYELRAGAICCMAYNTLVNHCTARNVTFPACTTATNKSIGGIMGQSRGTCTIIGCAFEQNSAISFSPKANNYFAFGGIVGRSSNTETGTTIVSNCRVNVNSITVTPNVSINLGGVIGYALYTSAINDCLVQNYGGNGNMVVTVNSKKSDEYTGGLCGYAQNDSYLQTFSNNTCHVDITEYKKHSSKTYQGVMFGCIYNGSTGSSNKLEGTGNSVTGSSLTLTTTGSGSNTAHGTSTYLNIIGEIKYNTTLPTNFITGTL